MKWAKFVTLIGVLWLPTVRYGPFALGGGASARESQKLSALGFEQEGRVAEAEAGWRSLLSSQPNDAEAYAHLGLLEARQEHYKEAILFYRKALSLNPKMPGLRLNLGLSYFKSEVSGRQYKLLNSCSKASPILPGIASHGHPDWARPLRSG